MSMRKLYVSFLIVLLPLLLTGCYNRGPITPDAWDLTEAARFHLVLHHPSLHSELQFCGNGRFVGCRGATAQRYVGARCGLPRNRVDRRGTPERFYHPAPSRACGGGRYQDGTHRHHRFCVGKGGARSAYFWMGTRKRIFL